jgi:hypothetical protein
MTDLALAEVLNGAWVRSKIRDPIVSHVMREVDFSITVATTGLASADVLDDATTVGKAVKP